MANTNRYYFDGLGFINIPEFELHGDFKISVRMTKSDNNLRSLGQFSSPTSDNNHRLYVSNLANGNLEYGIGNTIFDSGFTTTLNQEYLVTLRRVGTNGILEVNGVVVHSSTVPDDNLLLDNFTLAAISDGGSRDNKWVGNIRDLNINSDRVYFIDEGDMLGVKDSLAVDDSTLGTWQDGNLLNWSGDKDLTPFVVNGSWSDIAFFSELNEEQLPNYWTDEVVDPLSDPSKPNIQLFREDNNEFSKRMMNVVNQVNSTQQRHLWLFKDSFANSKMFGEFIWDNDLSDLAPFFTRDYWSNNYEAIINALEDAGTYQAFTTIIESALGSGSVIFEVSSTSHLRITIYPETVSRSWGFVNKDGNTGTLGPAGPHYAPQDVLVFADSIAQLKIQETVKLVELLSVNGIFVEISEGTGFYPDSLPPIDS